MRRRWLLLMPGLVLAAACSTTSVDIEARSDPNVDYSKYRTFKWIHRSEMEGGGFLHNPEVERAMRRGVERELHAKGIRQDRVKPDFLITYHAARKNMVKEDPDRLTGDRYWAQGEYRLEQYVEGTFVLEFLDAEERNVIWQGAMYGVLRNPDDILPEVEKIVADLLGKYPPR